MFVTIGFWELVIIVMVIAVTIGMVCFRLASGVPARPVGGIALTGKRGRAFWALSGLLFLLIISFLLAVWAN
jgi:hypothetical protein